LKPAPAPGVAPPPPRALWHLGAVGLRAARRRKSFTATGRGVRLAVLDTGIDASHADLSGKVVAQYRFDAKGKPRRQPTPRDTFAGGHGTFVAGLICGTATGIAPEAEVYSGVVIPQGTGDTAGVLAGLEWVASLDNVRLVVICSGGAGYSALLEDVCAELNRIGKLPVAAVGNEGPGQALNPGNCFSVLSVGVMTRRARVAQFSSSESRVVRKRRFRVPSLVAPGENVYSCRAGGGYTSLTGATPATAIVAGVAALHLQNNPALSAEELREVLLAGCRDLGEPPERQGHGLVQIRRSS
jgi:subtilisin family serine protease